MNPSYDFVLTKYQGCIKKMRTRTPFKAYKQDVIAEEPEIRSGHFNGDSVNRVVIHLRAKGCRWCMEHGCAMCNFWEKTFRQLQNGDLPRQFENFLENFDMSRSEFLCIFSAGSILNEEEAEFSQVEQIFSLIDKKLPHLKQVHIESRADYVEKEKLRALQRILKHSTKIALGIGLEAQDDVIRNLCVNKGLAKRDYERCIETCNSLGIRPVSYVLAVPPFLTEREAVEELIKTITYAHNVGSDVNIETMTIQSHSLVALLYEHGYYRLPWLYSIIEVLRRVDHIVRPYLTPHNYLADILRQAIPRCCPECYERIKAKIYREYCLNRDISCFDDLERSCCQKYLEQWRAEMRLMNSLSIVERVYRAIVELQGKKVI